MKLQKSGTPKIFFCPILCSEFKFFTNPPEIEGQTFALKSNSVELCPEFKFHSRRPIQMQELKFHFQFPISIPASNSAYQTGPKRNILFKKRFL